MIFWVLLISIGTLVNCRSFMPERVKIVDKSKGNFLVRGNIPIIDKKFAMSELKNEIQKVTGVKKSKQELIVYSLINHYTDAESQSAMIQQEYFNQHSEQGQLYFYPILGFFFSPGSLPEFLMRLAASYYQSVSYDKLESFLALLKKQMQTGKNKIIYIHCTHGLDRTGLVAAAYKMKYTGATLKNVMKENRALAQRDLKWTILNGISWFCEQLKISDPERECVLPRDTDPPEQNLEYEL